MHREEGGRLRVSCRRRNWVDLMVLWAGDGEFPVEFKSYDWEKQKLEQKSSQDCRKIDFLGVFGG